MHVRLLGPCFKTGRLKPFRQHPKRNGSLRCTAVLTRSCAIHRPAIIPPNKWEDTFRLHSSTQTSDVDLPPGKVHRLPPDRGPAQATDFPGATTGFKRFPFDNFTYYLTLFSKFFSSFPHGTCSLSVSRRYLALDGIYHPFWAAIPNNPTLGKRIIPKQQASQDTGLSPSMTSRSRELELAAVPRKRPSKLQFASPRDDEIPNLSYSRFTRRY